MQQLKNLRAEQVTTVIDLICKLEKRSRETILRSVSDEKVSASKLKERSSYSDDFLADLHLYIADSPPEIRYAVNGYIAGALGEAHGKLEATLSSWITTDEVVSESFCDRCTNENGQYLLFRSPSPGFCEIDKMEVNFDQNMQLVPEFETHHFNSAGILQSSLKGSLFEIGNYAYAIGKSKGNRAMRISKLRAFTRPTGPTDMYGIRISQSEEFNRPYAHFIYCYQLQKIRTEPTLMKILTTTRLDDEILDKEIDEIEEIRNLLRAEQVSENGIVAKPFGG